MDRREHQKKKYINVYGARAMGGNESVIPANNTEAIELLHAEKNESRHRFHSLHNN